MQKRILITGGAGFIGSHLSEALVEKGNIVIVVDNLTSGYRENLNKSTTFYQYSLSERQKLTELINKFAPQIVLHLAAVASIEKLQKDPSQEAKELISGLSVLADKHLNPSLEKFIFFSSASVYAENERLPLGENSKLAPISFYGTYKLVAEFYLKRLAFKNRLNYIIFRLANVYGPRQRTDGEGGVVATFIGNAKSNKPLIIFGDGLKTRDFLYVTDVVSAVMCAIDNMAQGIYNLGTQKQTKILNLANKIISLNKSTNKIMYKDERNGEITKSALSNRLFSHFSWQPKVSLTQGLLNTIKWYQSR